jgi:hypothetical protein
MTRLLYNVELYETIRRKSSDAKDILWVCSPLLGSDVHRVFSQELFKKPPTDTRFVFRVNDFSVMEDEVNPYEIQYFLEHVKGIKIKSNENFHSTIYIFDNSALLTSATLITEAFESNIEVGILLEGSDAEELKRYFNESLWNTSKPIGELKKYKLMWNLSRKNAKKVTLKKTKPHTQMKDLTNDFSNTWFIGVSHWLSTKSEHKIKKETNWQTYLSILGDVGYNFFSHVKLRDQAYIADLSKRGKIEVELVRIFDKARVETDEGDLHGVFEVEKAYTIERESFYEMLKNANINSKTAETILNDDQINQITNVLSSIKRKRRNKSKPKKNR